jgi:hypothetical protein
VTGKNENSGVGHSIHGWCFTGISQIFLLFLNDCPVCMHLQIVSWHVCDKFFSFSAQQKNGIFGVVKKTVDQCGFDIQLVYS